MFRSRIFSPVRTLYFKSPARAATGSSWHGMAWSVTVLVAAGCVPSYSTGPGTQRAPVAVPRAQPPRQRAPCASIESLLSTFLA